MLPTMASRDAALEKANHVRLARTAAKRTVKAVKDTNRSRALCASLIEAPFPELERMRAVELVGSCHRTGGRLTARLLLRAGVSEQVTIGALTERQRGALCRVLREGFR